MSDHLQDGVPPVDAGATKPQPETQQEARTIGPYRLLQRVGEGGMGEVWLAEQRHPVRRQDVYSPSGGVASRSAPMISDSTIRIAYDGYTALKARLSQPGFPRHPGPMWQGGRSITN